MLNFDLSKPDDQERFYDAFLMALCLWREARGEPVNAKLAVACVIRNRARHPSWWGGPSISSVVLKPKQFSSFNSDDPNAVKWPKPFDSSWQACLEIAQQVIDGAPDVTEGATHYHDDSIAAPAWTRNMTMVAKVGAFLLYR